MKRKCRFLGKTVSSAIFLIILMFMILAVSVPVAKAAIYDDFNMGTTIDLSKWPIVHPPAPVLLSQHDGQLFFTASTSLAKQTLVSPPVTGNFITTMEFHNFSTNSNVSWVIFFIGPPDNQVNILRGRDGTGNEVCITGRQNAVTGQLIEGWYVINTTSANGQLRFSYMNGEVSAYYHAGLDPETGWFLLHSFKPGWETSYTPVIGIGGRNGGACSTSFQIDNVTLAKVPLYDSFDTGTTIDTSNWPVVRPSTPILLSQHDGRLFFSAFLPNVKQSLYSTPFTGNFATTMEFYNFNTSSNVSWAWFLIGPPDNQVSILRGRNGAGDEVCITGRQNAVTGQLLEGWYGLPTTAKYGQLGYSFADGILNAYYRAGLDPEEEWLLLHSFTPAWPEAYTPAIGVGGNNREPGATAFQIDNVTVATNPIISCNSPATMTPPDAPISFTATSVNNCSTPSIQITDNSCVGKKGNSKMDSCVVTLTGDTITILDSGGVGDTISWTVQSVDSCGNTTTKSCSIEVVNPGKKNKEK